ncbi:MAG: 1-acyl-sn-glycerol-3-phosphate acyltransferase [Candidatus Neomarinimicrobiota bacterium]|nr:1-acyl-sn-glycerol-3-phosphate acyltransferase [Candidatus Neomarinimicrobiota bacterium]
MAIKLFFNQISIQNKQIVPNTSPIIFVANHPNFFMDPLIIGSYCPRQLYFFAKSTLFNSPLKKRILTRLNLVPVYRKIDDKENMGGNVNSFNKGYRILENNGAFLIFPEGISVGKRVLGKIKTGAARIGLEAELKNDFALNIVIIPIGLSYSDQVRFRSNIMIRFGSPIELSKFEKEYKRNEVETVKKVTLIIEKSLNNLTNYYQTDQIEDIVQGLELIYKMELMTELGMEVDNKNDDFIISKILTDAVQWYKDNELALIIEFREKLNKYIDLLKQLDIRDEFLDPVRQEKRGWGKTKTILFLVIGSPLFIWGIITNYIPYILPRVLVEITNKDQSEEASWKLIYGFIFFVFYYAVSITFIWKLTQNIFLTILFISSLIPSGDFALYYSKNINKYKQHVKFLSIFYKKRSLIFEIIQRRIELLQFIEKSKNRYLQTIK